MTDRRKQQIEALERMFSHFDEGGPEFEPLRSLLEELKGNVPVSVKTGQIIECEGYGFMFGRHVNGAEVVCFSVSPIANEILKP